MPATRKKQVSRLKILALGCGAGSVLFFGTVPFHVRLYLYMRGFAGHEGDVVLYAHDQYLELLSAVRGLFFIVFPAFGFILLVAGWMIWRAARYVSETSA